MVEVLAACGHTGSPGADRAAFDAAVGTGEGRAAIAAAARDQAGHFDLLGLQLGSTYPPGPGTVVDDGSPAPAPVDAVRTYVPGTRPGGRLPHAWVARGGRRVSTLDLVPPDRYVLVTASGAWADAAAPWTDAGTVPLDVVRMGVDVLDPGDAWAAVSGIGSGGAVLVRPDQHVAWRSVGAADEPAAVLAAVLGGLGASGG